jgi:CubicO group peptidase (beta-lactamase class C family)
MSTNQIGSLYRAGLGWGLGFETVERFGASGMSGEGSFGWGGAYGSIYRVDPDARLVMVMMIQLVPNATDIREVFPTLIYQAMK